MAVSRLDAPASSAITATAPPHQHMMPNLNLDTDHTAAANPTSLWARALSAMPTRPLDPAASLTVSA